MSLALSSCITVFCKGVFSKSKCISRLPLISSVDRKGILRMMYTVCIFERQESCIVRKKERGSYSENVSFKLESLKKQELCAGLLILTRTFAYTNR